MAGALATLFHICNKRLKNLQLFPLVQTFVHQIMTKWKDVLVVFVTTGTGTRSKPYWIDRSTYPEVEIMFFPILYLKLD